MATKAIKFFASWCGPCKIYGKTWSKVEQELTDVEFIEVDIDKDTSGLAVEYKEDSVPHTVVVKEDGSKKEETGRLNAQELKELILF